MAADDSVALILALAGVWAAIRARHPDVPDVVLLPAPAPRGDLSVLGHFAALRWHAKKGEGRHLHEVVVVAEHLNREAEDIVETLLHEAAHAMNFERGIRDCSKSQYHNVSFKKAAMELGLMVEQVRHYGFALTRLPSETKNRYEEETGDLADVLIHRRTPTILVLPGLGGSPPAGGPPSDPERPGSRSRKATCVCGFIIRVSKSTMDKTEIRCMSCGMPFLLVD